MMPCPECGTPMTIFGQVEGKQAIACSKCSAVFALVRCLPKPGASGEEKKS